LKSLSFNLQIWISLGEFDLWEGEDIPSNQFFFPFIFGCVEDYEAILKGGHGDLGMLV
jgi:hypothetical protein